MTPNKLNEFNHAEDPARRLLEQLGWTYAPAEQLAMERANEGDVLLKDRLRATLLRLNHGLTGRRPSGSSTTWRSLSTASRWWSWRPSRLR